MSVHIFWMPKEGHSTSEYEDAYATSDPDRLPFRAAVADGATESAYSGPWARRLTSAYAQGGDLQEALPDLSEAFHRISRRRPLPWYLEAKSAEGSHAAFAGIELTEDGEWTAQAVGDCCLLHLREHELLRSWPLASANEFSSTPDLISSRESEDDRPIPTVSGTYETGDRFILATDALSAWLLEHGRAAGDGFEDRVEQARKDGTMQNDDVTAIIIDT